MRELKPWQIYPKEPPVLPLPVPARTNSLCATCLNLLSYVVANFGDGTSAERVLFGHSYSMDLLSTTCVICKKMVVMFAALKTHASFYEALVDRPNSEWSIEWASELIDHVMYPKMDWPQQSASVGIAVTYRGPKSDPDSEWDEYVGGCTWFERFYIYLSPEATKISGCPDKLYTGESTQISAVRPLDSPDTENKGVIGAENSTFGVNEIALAKKWIDDCLTNHEKCRTVFKGSYEHPKGSWFPDRLIKVYRLDGKPLHGRPMIDEIGARLVLKENTSEFPRELDGTLPEITFLTLSHSWGPEPQVGEQPRVILTDSNLEEWKTGLPLVSSLPATFRDALLVTASLGCQYIWIDSLCIIQGSKEDWKAQAPYMQDVYKYGMLNIAAMQSRSDREPFIMEDRDPRIATGFSVNLVEVLSPETKKENEKGQKCLLLNGESTVIWSVPRNLAGSTASNAPLYERAWVYQERAMAPRILAFGTTGISYACDVDRQGEHPLWGGAGLDGSRLRQFLHGELKIWEPLMKAHANSNVQASPELDTAMQQLRKGITEHWSSFDFYWHGIITAYTWCKLTYHKDKLMAISSLASTLAETQLVKQYKYFAGIWGIFIPKQLGWITVDGAFTRPRKTVGQDGYTAPSWSWASLDGAKIQPQTMTPSVDSIPLIDVREISVNYETDFQFGSVLAGYIRISGKLNRIARIESIYRSNKLTFKIIDAATQCGLWLCADSKEVYQIVASTEVSNLFWLPLVLRNTKDMVECKALVLREMFGDERKINGEDFIRENERVFARIGTANWGRIPRLLLESDPHLVALGEYTPVEGAGFRFKRSEAGFEEFVLV